MRMIMHTKLRNALISFAQELELEIRQSQNEKITDIVNLYIDWNSKKITQNELVSKIEIILKDEIAFAWQEFIKAAEITK